MIVFKKCQYFVGKNGEILISRKKKNEYFFRCTLFSASIIIIISSPNYFFFSDPGKQAQFLCNLCDKRVTFQCMQYKKQVINKIVFL